MNTTRTSLTTTPPPHDPAASHPSYWGGIATLAGKDIVDAVKNKTILTIIVGLAVMILSVQALPLLLRLDARPRVAIYDGARTRAADLLRREGTLQIVELRSESQVVEAAVSTSGPLLAVSLPQDWTAGSGPLTLAGYVVHWVRPTDAAAAAGEAETALSTLTGRPVAIELHTVYPTARSGGHTVMVGLGFVIAILMITSIIVPYLLLEEKTGHTLEMLRVAPVTEGQIVIAKGLTGLLFGAIAAAVLLAFNVRLVHFWDVILLAVFCGALLGVSLGLLVGMEIDDEGGVQLWIGVISVLLIAPLMTLFIDSSHLPAGVERGLQWLPTIALFDLVRLAFTGERQPAAIASESAVILGAVILVFGLVTWRLRRWEAV